MAAKTRPRWLVLRFLLVILMYLVIDWNDLSPWRPHADYRFEIVGESIAIVLMSIVVAVMFWITPDAVSSRSGVDWWNWKVSLRFLGAGLLMGSVYSLVTWRQFFPNQRFRFPAGSHQLRNGFVAGVLWGMVMLLIRPVLRTPIPEGDKSVV
jgi:hypothetical protein